LNSPGAIPFEPGALSLQDAIGRAGGIASDRGALGNVYVFRRQAPGESFILRERDGSLRTVTGDVIVRANFADPVTQLNAAAFQMRGGDILYVGEKPLVRFARFLRLARGASQAPASEG
jgi:polysaccharide export outer membrane protein